jgi:ribosomal protein S18 acetylase RimI-like enzyme
MATIVRAAPKDAEEILALQKLAYQVEARRYDDWTLPPLTETLDNLRRDFASSVILKALADDGRLIGSVRAKAADGVCHIARLMVHPEFRRQGLGSRLLREIETWFPDVARYQLFTGDQSDSNIRLYERHGYTITRREVQSLRVTLVIMEKPRSP